jgi:predicted ATPase
MSPVTPAGALVGRNSEMELLTRLIKQVARGRGSSVLIEGEPGIGKSALVQAAIAETQEAGCAVFRGAGDELGQALPLLPFLDGLHVREPSANPRRNTIVGLLRGEVSTDPGTDVPAILAEQLLALVAEQCASWSSTTCSGLTRPASRCGRGWRGRRGRCRCSWSG